MIGTISRIGLALAAALLLRPAVVAAAEPAAPPHAAAPKDWSATLKEWLARAERGEEAAPPQLCELYFDARNGAFDAASTIAWCRRAADQGNPRAMQRLGLLSLAGVGTAKDLDTAAKLCARAYPHDTTVSASFCLAAVNAERQRAGDASGAASVPAPPPLDPALAKTVSQWREAAEFGDHAAAARLCDFHYGAHGGTFDPVKAAEWCRRAAGRADAGSLRRLGMMSFWGAGVERDLPRAEALCAAAQDRDPAVSGAFCLAAIRQDRAAVAAQTVPSRLPYPGPDPAALRLERRPDPLALDRVLESVHTTDTGLHYNCRDILRWARYESTEGIGVISADTRAFGRAVIDYEDRDYATLEKAAADCSAAIAPYDKDGGSRRQIAEFRALLPLMKARQRELRELAQDRRGDVSRCVDAMRKSLTDTRQIVSQAGSGQMRTDDIYSCTAPSWSQPVSANRPAPAKAPQVPGGGR